MKFVCEGVRLRLFISALLNCFLVLCLHQSLTRLTPELCSTLLLMSPVLTNLVTSVMGGEHMGMFRVVILSGYIAGMANRVFLRHKIVYGNPINMCNHQ